MSRAAGAYEASLKLVAQRAMAGAKPLLGPLALSVRAVFAVPPSWSARRRTLALYGSVRPTGKPDCDNVLKMIDALNGVVWADDAQVVDARVVKVYGLDPRLEITVGSATEAAC